MKEPTVEERKGITAGAAELVTYRESIRTFIYDMWKLTPQPVRPEFQDAWNRVVATSGDAWEAAKGEVKAEWFGRPLDPNRPDLEWEWYTTTGWIQGRSAFLKKKYFTWQQNLILIGVEKAVAGDAKRLISVVSGHGIGKSATCSWIILWFLYCFLDAQVPVTAPTTHQMKDVLWKELSIWISRMPDTHRALYQWQSDYVRMMYSPTSWFARARTATKENTEAIAGVHAEHVAIVVDEASGVPQQVFNTAEGALTGGNVLVVLISNGTQTTGYFYDTHHALRYLWQNFRFNGEESPVVDRAYIALKYRHGKASDEYKVRVLGVFPGEDIMDLTGYMQLFPEAIIMIRPKIMETRFVGRRILAIDPSGEGKDATTFCVRDRFKAEIVSAIGGTNEKEIAERALTLIAAFGVEPADVVIGAFGTGFDVAKEIAVATSGRQGGAMSIYAVLEGNLPEKEERHNSDRFRRLPTEIEHPYRMSMAKTVDNPNETPPDATDLYLNIRALMYHRALTWLSSGGQIIDESVDNSPAKEELKSIRWKRTLHGNRIQLMSKKERVKLGMRSPNRADAFALSFLRNMDEPQQSKEDRERIEAESNTMSEEERHDSL